MRESSFTASLREKLHAHGIYALKLHLSFANGVADCWYSGWKGDLWSEHKFLQTLPPSVDPTKLLTPLQQLWLKARHTEGRAVAVIVGSPEGCLLLPGVEWQRPIPRAEFRERMVDKKKLAAQLVELLGPRKGS